MTPPADNPKKDAWTVGELLDWTAKHLAQQGAESPRLDAEVLLAHALECRRIELYTRHGEVAAADVRKRFRELINQRTEGCPVAYLVGRKEFFSLPLEVSRAVLIPRPESEFVVMECLRLAKDLTEPTILDIGVGSGNLSVAIAHQHKTARITAVDISPEALAVATGNAGKHGVAERIAFLEGDLFAPLAPGAKFDFVVSNPPYIPTADIAGLARGVKDYEPHRALDGGPDGFAVFDRLIHGVRDVLKPGGCLIVEIGAPQEQTAREKIAALDCYDLGDTIHDHSGHARVLRARLR